MSIWINDQTRVIVQGITGKSARYHTQAMLAYGTKIVAGVTPGRGGEKVEDVPVYDTVLEAKQAQDANSSIIYVPAPYAADAILEAIDAEIELIVCITEHIPQKDMLKVKNYIKGTSSRLLGPNCPGLITPGMCKLGIMPGEIHQPGHVGIVSRSGTLTYEAVSVITKAGLGQSTAVGIGGDPVKGTDFIDVLKAFNEDPDTHEVVLIGEIGGNAEENAAKWIKAHMKKPVIAFISGQKAPKGKRMGHAGAIISGNLGTAESKMNALREAGVKVVEKLSEIEQNLSKSS